MLGEDKTDSHAEDVRASMTDAVWTFGCFYSYFIRTLPTRTLLTSLTNKHRFGIIPLFFSSFGVSQELCQSVSLPLEPGPNSPDPSITFLKLSNYLGATRTTFTCSAVFQIAFWLLPSLSTRFHSATNFRFEDEHPDTYRTCLPTTSTCSQMAIPVRPSATSRRFSYD